MNENIRIEQYRKSSGGKIYRCVRFLVGGHVIEIYDIKTDSDEAALQKARKLLAKAIEL